jgi:hypothetical protein
MPEDELFKELERSLTDVRFKKYITAYMKDGTSGLSTKFDKFVEADINET